MTIQPETQLVSFKIDLRMVDLPEAELYIKYNIYFPTITIY